MTTSLDYFTRLLPELSERSRAAILGRMGFSHPALYRHLSAVFEQPFGSPGSLLAAPSFEASFGWKVAREQMRDLAGDLLSDRLVDAMDNPPDVDNERCPERNAQKRREAHPYRFGRDRHPYRHQLEAWETLAREPAQSLIVASGTGSGKTECFMVPILDRLVREQTAAQATLVGVRALFLYPLNALINSQRERLRAWTDFGEGRIRFCLYNGNTPEKLPAHQQHQAPNEVLDRTRLRESPPPILVTNATMLEYMLVRAADAPILEQSRGKLQWVVLDEAHTYVGSQAAELALLIRRVLHAFGVTADQVRFVATSATIGDPQGEAGQRLKTFLAEAAGVDEARVHLVVGRREVPEVSERVGSDQYDFAQIAALDPSVGPDTPAPNRHSALAGHAVARAIRQRFIDNGERNRQEGGSGMVATLDEVCEVLYGNAGEFSREQQQEALRWLDLLSGTRDEQQRPFLPLRGHLFHQTLAGLWACADPACTKRAGTALDDPSWPFGAIYLQPRQHCRCGAPVYELVACDECGAPHLLAAERGGCLLPPRPPHAVDEFALDSEDEEVGDGQDEETDLTETADVESHETRVLIVNRPGLAQTGSEIVERESRRWVDHEDTDLTLRLILQKDAGDGLICPCCGGRGTGRRELFQPARIGTPFALSYLLPNLLEYAPDESCKPADLPYRGRRLLTFNDSRQGTARMAARLQQESERNRVRGLVYHLTLREGLRQSSAEVTELRKNIEVDEGVLPHIPPGPGRQSIEERLRENREKLVRLGQPIPIPFDDLARHLSESGKDFERMHEHYRKDVSYDSFGGDTGPLTLAKLFLLREFGRRPKRQNSLETMGLVAVRYPALEQIRTSPDGLSLEEWRDFLKIALDHFVRGGGSLALDDTSRRWLGTRFARNRLVPRDRVESARGTRRWPRAVLRGKQPNLRSRLVRLLTHVLQVDLETTDGEDRIDAALDAAWRALTIQTPLLTPTGDGYLLLPGKLAFAPVSDAWICPVTRRFLDTCFRGITPYLPIHASDANARCRPVTLPLYDRPFGGDLDALAQVASARSWITKQPVFETLRSEAMWNPLNDRTIELAPYFTAAEHSAQQDSQRLQQYETAFKRGELNLLSCSTTMEMGIDIGGIAMVAMSNVPPHPANYLQRAGRAGRRREARSLAFTLCKPNPHDQAVFSRTNWPFITPLPAPRVALDSEVIVQRHINALALATFLKRSAAGTGQDNIKLNSAGFFTGPDDASTPVQQFIDSHSAAQSSDPDLDAGIRSLARHTRFEGIDPVRIRHRVAEAMLEVRDRWLAEWQALRQQVDSTGPDDNPAHKAAVLQMLRLEGEYLLRELADQGFLPAYGFPTHIAAFDQMTAQQARQNKSRLEGRDDNRYRHRELPSRDSVTALREYAPGAEVVLDGLVYRSAGITLNWKIPASEVEAREPQAIRHAWRCRCGASGSARTLEQAMHCEVCGDEIEPGNRRAFIEPAGYAVDFYEDPHNDVSTQDFIPVEPAWISAAGDWRPLPNPDLGRLRVTPRGHIFHHSGGLHGQGYALCLECGRMEPMLEAGKHPRRFEQAHKRLRGDRKPLQTGQALERHCPGSDQDWAIKPDLHLGVETHTDILELQLRTASGQWLADRTTALTLAVALREALAGRLGVRADEIGCAVQTVSPEGETKRQSIFLFDRHAAGYSSSADRLISELLQAAQIRLGCPSDCDSACPQCILAYDQRFEADSLNRHRALEFLTHEWLNALCLPEALAFFGPDSSPEYATLDAAVLRELQRPGASAVGLYASATETDLGPAPWRQLALRLAGLGHQVALILDASGLAAMEDDERQLLAALATVPNIRVGQVSGLPKAGHGWVLAEVRRESASAVGWACPASVPPLADESWGRTDILIRGVSTGIAPEPHWLSAEALRPAPPQVTDREIEVRHHLDGTIQEFGERFWRLVADEHSRTRDLLDNTSVRLQALSYQDRYLVTPLAVALLLRLTDALRQRLGSARWEVDELTITTTSGVTTGSRPAPLNRVWSNWPHYGTRDQTLHDAFSYLGIQAAVLARPRHETGHGRVLTLDWSDGARLSLRLDQGLSYWRARHGRHNDFDFDAGCLDQAEALVRMEGLVEGLDHATQLFVAYRSGST
ncbi:DEAD/DEAH box helicase [Thioalkalivibrio sp.]|uniref:DEAD/DEAH box helicase n=1 Tax=Thioalkalivibrio sp. TaxID=2093813 RepID=UPI003567B1B7